jgi:hypothetical protein
MTGWRTSLLALLLTAASAIAAAGQDPLATARELYAGAAYEEALQVLDRLRAGEPGAADERAIEQYRAFCLLALGREDEAERAIEAVIAASPSFQPSTTDVSPRIRAAFSDVRRRVLPAIIQRMYAEAKAAFDRKEYEDAVVLFGRVIDTLKDPDVSAAADAPPLSDLRTLAAGFIELSLAAAPPPPPPVEPAPPEAPLAPPPAPAPIYTAADSQVVPPVVIRQELPAFTRRSSLPRPGVIEIVINEAGAVESALMRTPMEEAYDRRVIEAAVAWRYVPAMLDGVAVKYRKMVQIVVRP